MNLKYELFNGVSLQLHDVKSAEQTAITIAAMPSVKNVWPVERLAPLETRAQIVPAPANDTESNKVKFSPHYMPHVMTQVDKLHARGITGRGVKVAVIDTGIDYMHPAMGGCFGRGCLVSFGTDFVGDNYDGTNQPNPKADPMDCAGHGTHVAGIIAARQNTLSFMGAAPGVTLGAYKIYGCTGSVTNDILIAAFLQAYEDGAHIITTSNGGSSGWANDIRAVVLARIVDRGVPCIASAGNDGYQGLFTISSPATNKKVTAVASFENLVTPSVNIRSRFRTRRGRTFYFDLAAGTPQVWGITMLLRAVSLQSQVDNDACSPLPSDTPDLSNNIILVRRGGCTYATKVKNVASKGGKYIIFYNLMAETVPFDLEDSASLIKATGMVPNRVGESWVKTLAAGEQILMNVPNPFTRGAGAIVDTPNRGSGGAVNQFSSWGPTYDVDLKPQIGAPGGSIISTYPRAKGGYAVLSGTSMACPMITAVYALIFEARRTNNPGFVMNLLSSTAKQQLLHNGQAFTSFLAPPAQQGAGMVQAYEAARLTSYISPSSLSFNDTNNAPPIVEITISNGGRYPVVYTLGHVPSVALYPLSEGSPYLGGTIDAVEAFAILEFSHRGRPVQRIRLNPGQRIILNVKAVPPSELKATRLPVWSGYITINGTDESALSIPYQGIAGSLQDATIWTQNSFFMVFNQGDGNYITPPPKTTINLPLPGTKRNNGVDFRINAYPALGIPLLAVEVVPLDSSVPGNLVREVMGIKTIGQPAGFPRNWLNRGFNGWSWTGELASGNFAPPGHYMMTARALKIFGNPAVKNGWNVVNSQSFYLKYS